MISSSGRLGKDGTAGRKMAWLAVLGRGVEIGAALCALARAEVLWII
jgi:hypothetical protein